ncbi:MAG: DUF1653 domain-containing protein [Bacilli bacterium]|nr:DUF1653 domain-containing protein [Bacilli bacterium]MDD4548061.1 DUF1653 domain-containing protein [Bacilli bacterium]
MEEKRTVEIGKIYRHFKGKDYQVLAIANDSEDHLRQVVVYQALYGDKLIWIRELEMFLSLVDKEKYPDVNQKYRFEIIS